MFVSNSDNLGASLDLNILSYFAASDAPFMMECCKRTPNDKKGGHLAKRVSDGQLILRESAMCADEDEEAFQDITKHRFFNTNNLWIRLDKLKEIISSNTLNSTVALIDFLGRFKNTVWLFRGLSRDLTL